MRENFKSYEFDIIVIGAGIAGISAAVKAATLNSKVLLVEQYPFVGGMSTAGMVSPFMKHSINGIPLVRGVFENIENEMITNDGMIDNGFYAHSFRLASYQLLKNSNVNILLSSSLLNVYVDEKEVKSITVISNGQKLKINGKIFIDTTGDAQLLHLSNLPYEKGDIKKGDLQAMTLFFRMANINMEKVFDYVLKNKNDFFNWMDFNFDLNKIISVAGFFSNVQKAITENRLSKDVKYIFFTTLPESGEASFNTTNILGLDGSTSEDLTKAEVIGRKQIKDVFQILINEVPGFENSFLLETAPQVGVRETRRAIGDYIITGEDIKKAKKFDDAIARACYGIDIHGQKDDDSKMEYLNEGEYYEIPLRALFVKNIENVLVAGRCISSTREGHSAVRIQPTSSATGEACGTVAALACKHNVSMRNVDYQLIRNNIIYNLNSNEQ